MIEEIKIKDGFMKKIILFTTIICLLLSAAIISCDSSGGDSDEGSEATLLGDSINLSGTVDRTFDTDTQELTLSYSNPVSRDFRLYDETDNFTYDIDENAGANVNIDLSFTGAPASEHLYYPGDYGIDSSNSSAKITTAVIDVDGTNDDIVNGNFTGLPALWYYYLYSTAETTLDGSSTDDESTYIFNNVTVFEGWNRLIISTSDGETFTYKGGNITGAHWTYMDNSEPVLIAM